MGWSIGYDDNWQRDIGYGVPAICDHPECDESINRGLSYVCGSEPYGGARGCGLYFCERHRSGPAGDLCERCCHGADPFAAKPDVQRWNEWKLTDESWSQWRRKNPDQVAKLNAQVGAS